MILLNKKLSLTLASPFELELNWHRTGQTFASHWTSWHSIAKTMVSLFLNLDYCSRVPLLGHIHTLDPGCQYFNNWNNSWFTVTLGMIPSSQQPDGRVFIKMSLHRHNKACEQNNETRITCTVHALFVEICMTMCSKKLRDRDRDRERLRQKQMETEGFLKYSANQ